MGRMVSRIGVVLLTVASMALVAAPQPSQPESKAELDQQLRTFEQALGADPENLSLSGEYRTLTVAAGRFDRAIDFFRGLARRPGSGPNVKISLALAYVDKVPPAGDIRRLYLGRDAMNALTESAAIRPCVLAYYLRGQINLYYNRFIFHRTDQGVADLMRALSLVTERTPPSLVARVYIALGDGYFRLEDVAKAHEIWTVGRSKFPDDADLRMRLEKDGQALLEIVTAALSAGRRSDTSLTGLLPLD
jgi:tetratricopeptide (TPR) repeat protein